GKAAPARGMVRVVAGAGGGGLGDGVAPDAGLDDGDGELRLPLEAPELVERPGLPGHVVFELSPGDSEDVQAVEEVGLGEVGLFAEVEVDLLVFGGGLE